MDSQTYVPNTPTQEQIQDALDTETAKTANYGLTKTVSPVVQNPVVPVPSVYPKPLTLKPVVLVPVLTLEERVTNLELSHNAFVAKMKGKVSNL
jgi:hypothetical protein